MIRILNIIGSMHFGGAETFLMNVYRNIDREKIQFDFLLYSDKRENSYIDEIENLGGKIYVLPTKKSNFLQSLASIKKVVYANRYKIVWRHTDTPFKAIDLVMAKRGGAEYRILHSHSSNTQISTKILGNLTRAVFLPFVTHRYACGERAGRWMFGQRPFEIIANGIDVNKFKYNEDVREEYRNKYNLRSKIVIGHIGRFEKEKNHVFLLKLLEEILIKNKNVILILIGEGSLEDIVKKEVLVKGLDDYVKFWGTEKNIQNVLQMMDVFLLPSLWEGLPVTLIEAQASGLPCIVSDRVPKEAKILDSMKFIGLETSLKEWADQIFKSVNQKRIDTSEQIRKRGYDMTYIAQKLQNDFIRMGES